MRERITTGMRQKLLFSFSSLFLVVRELFIHSTVAQNHITILNFQQLFVWLNDKLDKGIDLAEKNFITQVGFPSFCCTAPQTQMYVDNEKKKRRPEVTRKCRNCLGQPFCQRNNTSCNLTLSHLALAVLLCILCLCLSFVSVTTAEAMLNCSCRVISSFQSSIHCSFYGFF